MTDFYRMYAELNEAVNRCASLTARINSFETQFGVQAEKAMYDDRDAACSRMKELAGERE